MPSKLFKIGDIVKLKSGSQDMTVEGYTDDGFVICTYWNDDKPGKTNYLEDELKLANDEETPSDEFP
jgi:uncharacterized protein YodC (DUF2158 family)